ncbi:hypothetical protein [Nannocystis sp.]|uniref:hypothetical protein n=1 Tax=Nannocystis sp. TaxID=1962667 RepID=UPI0025E2D80B|nr:hypothetical protein [Nannocystis sp.]MBK7829755.1 hypothetical protein [Nannocystis sp.]
MSADSVVSGCRYAEIIAGDRLVERERGDGVDRRVNLDLGLSEVEKALQRGVVETLLGDRVGEAVLLGRRTAGVIGEVAAEGVQPQPRERVAAQRDVVLLGALLGLLRELVVVVVVVVDVECQGLIVEVDRALVDVAAEHEEVKAEQGGDSGVEVHHAREVLGGS